MRLREAPWQTRWSKTRGDQLRRQRDDDAGERDDDAFEEVEDRVDQLRRKRDDDAGEVDLKVLQAAAVQRYGPSVLEESDSAPAGARSMTKVTRASTSPVLYERGYG